MPSKKKRKQEEDDRSLVRELLRSEDPDLQTLRDQIFGGEGSVFSGLSDFQSKNLLSAERNRSILESGEDSFGGPLKKGFSFLDRTRSEKQVEESFGGSDVVMGTTPVENALGLVNSDAAIRIRKAMGESATLSTLSNESFVDTSRPDIPSESLNPIGELEKAMEAPGTDLEGGGLIDPEIERRAGLETSKSAVTMVGPGQELFEADRELDAKLQKMSEEDSLIGRILARFF